MPNNLLSIHVSINQNFCLRDYYICCVFKCQSGASEQTGILNTSRLYLTIYEGVSKSFWTSFLEWELPTIQLSATWSSCIAILWVSVVSFDAVTLWVASQRVFIVVCFVIDSVQELLDTPSYFYPFLVP